MEAILIILKTFGPQITLGIVGVGVVLFFLIYIVSAVTGKNFGFELGPFKINTRKNGKGSDNESHIDKIKTLLKFDNSRDNENSLIESICDIIKSKTREKDIIEFQQTVINQMTCAEDFNIQIKMILTDVYAKLMKEKDETIEVRHSKDYKYYQILVSSILDELKRNTLRESIRSIDLSILTTLEFEQFADQKISVMISQIDQYLELMYQNTSLVSWDDVHNKNETIAPQIRDLYRILYSNIKIIAIENAKDIKEISTQMEGQVEQVKSQIEKGCVITKLQSIIEEKEENNKKEG